MVFAFEEAALRNVFSPDSNRVGVFYCQRDSSCFDVILKIYEIPSGRIISEFPSLTKYRYAETYFPQPVYAYWAAKDQIVYEDKVYINEEAAIGHLAALDPLTGEKKVLMENFRDLIASAGGNMILASTDEASYLADLFTQEKRKVLNSVTVKAVWDNEARQLALFDEEGSLFHYEMDKHRLTKLDIAGEPVDWLDSGQLLIIVPGE